MLDKRVFLVDENYHFLQQDPCIATSVDGQNRSRVQLVLTIEGT